ncbi:hypothetical protein [Alicyclobacillus fodiniaquatilis]|uniref:EAL domain-containing protein n=1 Tax=Alicyclobacillus fodiniaquatilis TaxID=1661150 RepID=A0ABW4JC71_9BACL
MKRIDWARYSANRVYDHPISVGLRQKECLRPAQIQSEVWVETYDIDVLLTCLQMSDQVVLNSIWLDKDRFMACKHHLHRHRTVVVPYDRTAEMDWAACLHHMLGWFDEAGIPRENLIIDLCIRPAATEQFEVIRERAALAKALSLETMAAADNYAHGTVSRKAAFQDAIRFFKSIDVDYVIVSRMLEKYGLGHEIDDSI